MPDSLAAIYRDHRPSLLGRALRIVRDPAVAEDVIQESCLRAHSAATAAAHGETIENLAGFLHRTVRNLALDHLRRRRTRERMEVTGVDGVDAEAVADAAPSAEDRLLHRERLERFRAALDRLPERARRVWVLNRVEGWSYPRIAEHLGVSAGTVFNDMKLAVGHLHDAMSRHERR